MASLTVAASCRWDKWSFADGNVPHRPVEM